MKDVLGPYPRPAVFGHEGCGTIVALGTNVSGFKLGDKVITAWSYCQTCIECKRGAPAYCPSWGALNGSGLKQNGQATFVDKDQKDVHGGMCGHSSFGRHMVVHESSLVKVPDDTDLAINCPLSCGLSTGAGTVLNEIKPAPGSVCAVFGLGAVGVSMVAAFSVSPASRIIVVDLHASRLETAKSFGATDLVDASKVNVVETILALTGGRGVDYATDATGVGKVIEQAYQCLATRGTLALVGLPGPQVKLDLPVLSHIFRGQKVVGVLEGAAVPQEFIPFLLQLNKQGKFPYEKLVKQYPFSELDQALKDMHSGAVIKPVLLWE